MHYLLSDETPPRIYRLVDENRRAYHAGLSSWQGQGPLNAMSIGIEIVNLGHKPRPDGSSATIAITSLAGPLRRKLPYDQIRDFAPVTLMTITPLVLVARPSLPVDSVASLVEAARKAADMTPANDREAERAAPSAAARRTSSRGRRRSRCCAASMAA